ncbi:MAG: FkbM family methyltransferase [Clostridia bacterium]|nr:FkbM family methyltransferase [Clostridia bacterium]
MKSDLWTYLKNTDKPILMYGMGNGGDKIFDVCNKKGITICDIFASDDFVRGQKFHDKTVMKYSDAKEKYGSFIVLVAFGTCLDNVMDNIYRISKEQELYAPDVPVAGDNIFDIDFYNQNIEKIKQARNLFADDYSKKVYDELIEYKLDGKIDHFSIDTNQDDDLSSLFFKEYTDYIDLGAFNGDTIDQMLSKYPSIKNVIAFEPSERIFKKLTQNVTKYTNVTFKLINKCSSDTSKTLTFSDGSGRNSKIIDNSLNPYQGKTKVIESDSVDNQTDLKCGKVLLKYDVEGEEKLSLLGSQKTIKNNYVDMIVSVYHRSEDLFEIPLLLQKIHKNSKIYLRKHKYIPAWEINLYVTDF